MAYKKRKDDLEITAIFSDLFIFRFNRSVFPKEKTKYPFDESHIKDSAIKIHTDSGLGGFLTLDFLEIIGGEYIFRVTNVDFTEMVYKVRPK
jgi:hypothetical protein